MLLPALEARKTPWEQLSVRKQASEADASTCCLEHCEICRWRWAALESLERWAAAWLQLTAESRAAAHH